MKKWLRRIRDAVVMGLTWAVGWTLLLIGGLSTIPLAFEVLGNRLSDSDEEEWLDLPASAPWFQSTIAMKPW